MQKLMKAAREGTKDGLEKTKAAVKRGRSFIRTKSFVSAGVRAPPAPMLAIWPRVQHLLIPQPSLPSQGTGVLSGPRERWWVSLSFNQLLSAAEWSVASPQGGLALP